MNRIVTHYFPQPAEPAAWVPLVIVTRDATDASRFFLGLEDYPIITKEEIDQRTHNQELKELASPHFIPNTQSVWLSPSGDIWLAEIDDPVSDRNKVVIDTVLLPIAGRTSIKERLAKRVYEATEHSQILLLNKTYVRGENYKRLVARVVKHLEALNSGLAVEVPADSVPWDQIPAHMMDGVLDFCSDPYFATDYRTQVADIIPIGGVETYCCFVNTKAPLYARLILTEQESFARERLEPLWRDIPDLEIGLLGETAATSEVRRSLSVVPGLCARTVSRPDVVALRHWLDERPLQRLILCDQGVGDELNRVTPQDIRNKLGGEPHTGHTSPYLWREKHLRFRLHVPVRVGLVYPKGDERWAQDITAALAAAVIEEAQDAARIRQAHSWEAAPADGGITGELDEVGISAVSLSDLCAFLGIDELPRLTAELCASAAEERYEDMTRLNDELADMLETIVGV